MICSEFGEQCPTSWVTPIRLLGGVWTITFAKFLEHSHLKGEATRCSGVYGIGVREFAGKIAKQLLEIRKSGKVQEHIRYLAYFFCKERRNVRSNAEILRKGLTVITVIHVQVIVGFKILVNKINCLDELRKLGIFHYVGEGDSAVFVLGENDGAKGMWRCKAFERFAYEATRKKIGVVTEVGEFI